MTNNAYIYDAIRTPRGKGKKEGSLYEVPPIELVATLLHALQGSIVGWDRVERAAASSA